VSVFHPRSWQAAQHSEWYFVILHVSIRILKKCTEKKSNEKSKKQETSKVQGASSESATAGASASETGTHRSFPRALSSHCSLINCADGLATAA
jgi:hypothetical protein